MKHIIQYFFPPRRNQDRIPLGSRRYSSESNTYGQPPQELIPELRKLVAARCARTLPDAWMLYNLHPGQPIQKIIRIEQRRRRRRPLLRVALSRLKNLFWILLVIFLLTPTVASAAQPVATIIVDKVDVHADPDEASPVLGQLKRNGKLYVSALSADSQWINFSFWGKNAYIPINAVQLSVPVATLPQIEVKKAPIANIQLAEYTISPAVPAPGEPFEIALVLKNEGALDAGIFSVATSFQPSGYFSYATIGKLIAGQSGTVALKSLGENRTGAFTIQVAIDVDNQLNNLQPGSMAAVSYRVDRPYIAQASIDIKPFVNIDLHGGVDDLALNLDGLQALNGAQLMVLDVPLSAVHYDMLSVVKGQFVPAAQMKAGAIIGVITAEGRRGVIRVVSFNESLNIQYAIYTK